MALDAAIVVIGNEILSGKVRDTNSSFLIQELRTLGVEVRRVQVVPDEVPTIAEVVRDLVARFTYIFTSGGVGPTLDDVTLEGVARAFSVPLVPVLALERVIQDHFKERTLASHLKMALLPKGAELLWCPGLPWPGVMMRNVFILPGDPAILRDKFAALRERFRTTPFVLRRVYTLLEEGELAPHLDAVHAGHPQVLLGSYPVYDQSDYRVQVTLEAKLSTAVEAALKTLLSRLHPAKVVRVE